MNNVRRLKKYGVFCFSLLAMFLLLRHFDARQVAEQLKEFPLGVSGIVLGLLIINAWVVVYRYWRILSHLGFDLPWWLIVRASIIANIASLLVIPLFGQVAGRQAVLQSAGITAVENAVISGYERILVGGVSAILACIGATYLLGVVAADYISLVPVGEIVPIIVFAVVLSFVVSISRFEIVILKKLFTGKSFSKLIEAILITLVSSALMLSSFAILFHFVAPGISWMALFSAAAIVSFVAGLPISFGGWGPREVVSVYALGLWGVNSEKALAASILCGVLSISAIFLMAPFAMWRKPANNLVTVFDRNELVVPAPSGVEAAAAWLLCFGVATLILFQVHLPVGDTVININLSDPFAVLALAAVGLNAIFMRTLPHWRIKLFNGFLLIMSMVLGLGFLHGWFSFGSSAWAVGKLFGWAVLLGFLAAGYLCTSYFGVRGIRRIVETMVVILCSILVVQIALRSLHLEHIIQWKGYNSSVEGYSGNRNALAFQILAVCSVFVGFFPMYKGKRLKAFPRISCETLFTLSLAWMLAGLYYTYSRTGIAVAFCLLLFVVGRRLMPWRSVLAAAVGSALLCAAIAYVPTALSMIKLLQVDHAASALESSQARNHVLNLPYPIIGSESSQESREKSGTPPATSSEALSSLHPIPSSGFSEASSDALRWQLIKKSTELWLEAPVVGHGLGYFIKESPAWFGFPIVVHNTLLWLLVEVGLLGAIAFLVAFVGVCTFAFRNKISRVRNNGLILLMLSFSLMSLFHEMLYQRLFWFLIGALLAVSLSSVRSVRSGQSPRLGLGKTSVPVGDTV
ncbi:MULTISPECIES: lysylphosphatidylglycerol synthase transmembrane domain-containing protein [unclassified Pseudomonas]|uniref:lysylphosphatidylglycerol synthase transmembrane domain-containing protein n=1 Tax=unclassified Pseudomonas TaxID=196821 RepID=UPI0014027501|nr:MULTISPECIES: lysylphosphatidylglycerol synthase transmembrane domain-containing protein [unclassified Pseudomonas]